MKEVAHGVKAEVRLPPHLALQKTSTANVRRSSPAQSSRGVRSFFSSAFEDYQEVFYNRKRRHSSLGSAARWNSSLRPYPVSWQHNPTVHVTGASPPWPLASR